MKVQIPFKKILIMWVSVYFIFLMVILGVFFQTFFLTSWDFVQPLILSIYSIVMILILILAYNGQYYEINKKDLTEYRLGKKYTYFYNDIIYIDDDEALKHNTLCFVTKHGHVKYLSMDKDALIYKAMKNHCPNLMSKEEVKIKFPHIKF